MTKLQYERWQDFARRMVPIAVSARAKAPSRAATLEIIEFYFECRMDEGEEWQRVKDWDNTASENGHYGMTAGGHISDIAEHFVPGYWSLPDGESGDAKIEKWIGPATCCIRAGLDVAVSPSAGVAGFTAGDIRRMYPEGVPDWVERFFDDHEEFEVTGVVPGVGFTEKPTGRKSPPFAALADKDHVWL